MARLRDLKNRIRSVQNTKKITKTMEMVATAKSKRAQDAMKRARAFGDGVAGAAGLLAALPAAAAHPLLGAPAAGGAPAGLWLVTGNRGLCGGFNAAVVRAARERAGRLEGEGRQVRFWVQGKKGQLAMRHALIPFEPLAVERDDRPSFPEAVRFAEDWIRRFLAGEVGSLEAVSTRFLSAGVQKPGVRRILPVPPPPASRADPALVLLEPDPAALADGLLTTAVAVLVHQAMLESAAAEQIARRVAMKNATDNAEEMITVLTRSYNRARQAGITQEIAEIVGGAEALK